jgi:hypothetical protein
MMMARGRDGLTSGGKEVDNELKSLIRVEHAKATSRKQNFGGEEEKEIYIAHS